MEFLRVVILGAVQGLTEFLPISSDGHLLLIRKLFNWPDQGLMFDATLHLGTFFAVLYFYRKTWFRLAKVMVAKGTRNDALLLGLIIVATIPGALIGFFAEDFVGRYFRGADAAGAGFLLSAVFLFASDRVSKKRLNKKEHLGLIESLGVGLMQAIALLPGVSRSGSTVAAGTWFGLDKNKAVEFSFLMALPITGGAGLVSFLKNFGESPNNLPVLFFGFISAFVVGLWAIKFFIKKISENQSFRPFVVYLIAVAALSFITSLWA